MGSMLDMLKNMMEGGRDVGESQPQGSQPGNQSGQSGQQAGNGGNGTGQPGGNGEGENTAENANRRVPRNSGSTGSALPREFHKAMDAYNKGVEQETLRALPPK